MDWEILKKIPSGTPIKSLQFHPLLIEDDFFKIDDQSYLITAAYKDMSLVVVPGGPFLMTLLWACNEGAARKAHLSGIEEDTNQKTLQPPQALLPRGLSCTYGDILQDLKTLRGRDPLEHASYRIAKDGAFIHRVIETKEFSFYFRSPKHDDQEQPYAIKYSLQAQ